MHAFGLLGIRRPGMALACACLILTALPVQAANLPGYFELSRRLDEVLRGTSRGELAMLVQLARRDLQALLQELEVADQDRLQELAGRFPSWEQKVAGLEQVVPRNRYWAIARLREVVDPKIQDYLQQVRTLQRRAGGALALPEVQSSTPMGEVVRRGLGEMVRHTEAALRVAARIRGRYLNSETLNPYGGDTFWHPRLPFLFQRERAEDEVLMGLRMGSALLVRSRVPALVESLEVLEEAIPDLIDQPVERLGGRLRSWARIRRSTTHEQLLSPTLESMREVARVRQDQERLGRVLRAFRVRLGEGLSGKGRVPRGHQKVHREILRLEKALGQLTASWDPQELRSRLFELRAELRKVPEPDPFAPVKKTRRILLTHLEILSKSTLVPRLERVRSSLQEVEVDLSLLWSQVARARSLFRDEHGAAWQGYLARVSDEIGPQSRLSVD